MKTYFEFASRTPVLIVGFVASIILMTLIFPALIGDIEILDLRMEGYNLADVIAAMEGYGEAARGRYALVSLTLDTVFPICYASFYAGAIYRFAPHEKLKLLAYLPVIGGFVDLGENVQITAMLLQYPDIAAAQVEWSNRFTLVKFAFSRISMLLAFAALIWAAASAAYQRAKL